MSGEGFTPGSLRLLLLPLMLHIAGVPRKLLLRLLWRLLLRVQVRMWERACCVLLLLQLWMQLLLRRAGGEHDACTPLLQLPDPLLMRLVLQRCHSPQGVGQGLRRGSLHVQ
jgi:hypothetical protein